MPFSRAGVRPHDSWKVTPMGDTLEWTPYVWGDISPRFRRSMLPFQTYLELEKKKWQLRNRNTKIWVGCRLEYRRHHRICS
ncbi:hypothetical protein CEXT_534381 [Caerostris extrusa]|uniref:Uncharacterized protein n=1 Tax=Caerostris extrusa TaxID=172846 RepID=A0AAV4Y6X0_CAEEX|nr:hypothetical protein CEXT_534381 [Caerostris extrusa]